MKAISFSALVLFLMLFNSECSCKPRVIKGTVFTKEGKKASGVIVTAHRSKAKYYTSFDGTYEITASVKSKWLNFKFPDKNERLNIEDIKRDVINFGTDQQMNRSDSINNKEK